MEAFGRFNTFPFSTVTGLKELRNNDGYNPDRIPKTIEISMIRLIIL
jgi:hypothetical protein